MLELNKLTSGLRKNLEQNKLLLNLENFTSHCLKNPEILLVMLIGPLLIRPYCVYLKINSTEDTPVLQFINPHVMIYLTFIWMPRHMYRSYCCPQWDETNYEGVLTFYCTCILTKLYSFNFSNYLLTYVSYHENWKDYLVKMHAPSKRIWTHCESHYLKCSHLSLVVLDNCLHQDVPQFIPLFHVRK